MTPSNCQKRHPSQQGFSLIELVLAMALSVLVIGSAVQLLVGSQRSYQLLLQQARMQETARLALSYMASDIRQSSDIGCKLQSIPVANLVHLSATNFFSSEHWLLGWDNVNDFDDDVIDGTDVLELRQLLPEKSRYLINHSGDATTTDLSLTAGATLEKNQVMALVDSDCSNMAIFQATEVSQNGVHIAATGTNCSHVLRGHFDCNQLANADANSRYSADAQLYPLVHFAYAIHPPSANSLSDGTSLWRINYGANNQELVEGVDDLQLRYGLDTSNPADGVIDRYLDAEQIHSAANLSFAQVIAVEISLTVRAETNSIGGDALTTRLTTQVQLRNRGL